MLKFTLSESELQHVFKLCILITFKHICIISQSINWQLRSQVLENTWIGLC